MAHAPPGEPPGGPQTLQVIRIRLKTRNSAIVDWISQKIKVKVKWKVGLWLWEDVVIPLMNHQRALLRRFLLFQSQSEALKWGPSGRCCNTETCCNIFTLRHNYLLKQHVLAPSLMLLLWQLSLNVLCVYITVWVLKVHILSCRKQMSWPLCWRVLLLCV